MQRRVFFLALIMFCASLVVTAQERGAFSVVGVGARPAALGGSFVALADSADALSWNPAGLAQLNRPEFTTASTDLFGLGVQANWFSLAKPVGDKYTFGIAYSGLDASGAFGDFPYKESVVFGSLAGYKANVGRMGMNLNWGVNLKYAGLKGGSHDVNTSEQGLGVDLGLLWQGAEKYAFGISIRDLYTRLAGEMVELGETKKVTTKIAPDLRAGIAYRTGNTTWEFDLGELLTAPKAHLGVEHQLTPQMQVRAGYNKAGFACGFGLKTGRFVVDYAYKAQEAGDAQQLSLGLNF